MFLSAEADFFMPKPKNISVANELKDKVAKAKSVVVTDYRGMTHKQSEDLHKSLRTVGGEYVVVKNSLWRIAAKDTGYKLESSELTGPSAILLAYEDELAPLKELTKFIKTTSLPKIKFGFIAGTRYDEKQVINVSKLPGKEVLQAMLVSRMSGPLYGLLYTLNGSMSKLVYVLSQIKK